MIGCGRRADGAQHIDRLDFRERQPGASGEARRGAFFPASRSESTMAVVREAVIAAAVRTPIGKFLGALSPLTAPQLGAAAIKTAVQRAELTPDAVDQVIMGCVVQAGVGQAPARQAAIHAGIPDAVPAVTINKVCGSG